MIKWVVLALVLILLMSGFGYVSLSGNIVSKYPSDSLESINLEVQEPEKDDIEPESEAPKKPSSIVLSQNENADVCGNIVCQPSSKTCPDGFVASCENSCSKGLCSSCQLDCLGHDGENTQVNEQTKNTQEQTTENQQTESEQNQTQSQTQQQNQTPQVQQPKITNIKYDADGDDRKKETWNTEWVEIEGQGVDMFNWTLSDSANHVFVFPEFVINGLVKIRSGYGNNTQTDLYFGDGPIWNNNGDTAYLKDQNGNLVDEYTY